MARLTHPDFHPHDALAGARFRAVRQAYEVIQKQGGGKRGSAGALRVTFTLHGRPVTASISALVVDEVLVAIGERRRDLALRP
jgi:hypothetical protein